MTSSPPRRSRTRKYPPIDVLKLYSQLDAALWNEFLTRALQRRDVEGLKQALYGIQAGMAEVAAKNLNSEKVNLFFIRLQRSIEITAKKLFREKYPSPLDDSLLVHEYSATHLDAKRKRDHAFEKFLREASF